MPFAVIHVFLSRVVNENYLKKIANWNEAEKKSKIYILDEKCKLKWKFEMLPWQVTEISN